MNIDEPMDSQVTELSESEVPSLVFSQSLIGTPKARKVGELTTLLKVRYHVHKPNKNFLTQKVNRLFMKN